MRTEPISRSDWRGVFPVPPLARSNDKQRTIDWAENEKLVRHLAAGGITRFMYGGNAFLYHITLHEYDQLLAWLNTFDAKYWCIPSAGPSYGRLMDQAPLLRRYNFPAVMHLPCADPRDAEGLESGIRDFAEACGRPLILYLKEENNFGANLETGLDAVARLVRDGICIGIKYAVVRKDPATDAYLESLLKRVDTTMILSGIGERPAITHLTKFKLAGFTTGSGCLNPALSNRILDATLSGNLKEAEELRELFIPHEDLRDAWGPARVLHAATNLAEIAATGPIPPFVSALQQSQLEQLSPIAKQLTNQQVVQLS